MEGRKGGEYGVVSKGKEYGVGSKEKEKRCGQWAVTERDMGIVGCKSKEHR